MNRNFKIYKKMGQMYLRETQKKHLVETEKSFKNLISFLNYKN